jgi:DNA polymerase-1
LVKHDGVKNTKVAKLRMQHVMGGLDHCRLTEKGFVSLDSEACNMSDDPLLQEYAALTSLQTVVSKDIPALKLGRQFPVHSNFKSLQATGRTSSAGPNIQNIRQLPGIRECFVPRKGKVFVTADWDGLELRTLAQTCMKLFGKSKLAEVLNRGVDPHLTVASTILKISYQEAFRRNEAQDQEVHQARQTGKIANFGFPGGLGYDALILFAKRTYKIELTYEEAKQLKIDWMEAFPEMRQYFDHIGNLCNNHEGHDGRGATTIEQLFSKRIRGKIPFTVACNTYFQGLGSEATKNAGWLISKACYIDKSSPLYGWRIVNYIHDEFILEGPIEEGHAAAMELKRLMILGSEPYLPDVPPTVTKPMVVSCWSKKAKQVWKIGGDKPKNDSDTLVPWEYRAAA